MGRMFADGTAPHIFGVLLLSVLLFSKKGKNKELPKKKKKKKLFMQPILVIQKVEINGLITFGRPDEVFFSGGEPGA